MPDFSKLENLFLGRTADITGGVRKTAQLMTESGSSKFSALETLFVDQEKPLPAPPQVKLSERQTEGFLGAFSKAFPAGVQQAQAGIRGGIAATLKGLAGLLRGKGKTEVKPIIDIPAVLSREADKIQALAFKDLGQAAEIAQKSNLPVEDTRKFSEKIKDPAFIGQGLGMNLPNLLASLGVGVAVTAASKNPAAGLAAAFGSGFTLEAGFAYNDALQAGVKESEAVKVAMITGTANGLLETLPVGRVLKNLPGGSFVKRQILRRVTQNIVSQGLLEASTESLQEVISNAVAQTYDKNRVIFAGVPESALFGGILGGGLGVIETGAPGIGERKTATEPVSLALPAPAPVIKAIDLQKEIQAAIKDETRDATIRPADLDTELDAALDEILSGKKPMRIADTGTMTEFREALSPSEFARVFRTGEKAQTLSSPDEVAEMLGFETESDFLEALQKRSEVRRERRKTALPAEEPLGIFTTEIRPQDIFGDRVLVKLEEDAATVQVGNIQTKSFSEGTNFQNAKQARLFTDSLKEAASETSFAVPSGAASVGKFLDDTPVELGGLDAIKPVEFPELVSLTKELSGSVPLVGKLRRAAGRFTARGEKGEIRLTPELFKSENAGQLSKTLAHEIGHLIDWLPDKTLARGNIIGRLKSLRRFLKSTFGELSVTNVEIRAQLLRVSEWWRPYDEKTAPAKYLKYRKSSKELYADAISVLFNTPGTLEKMAPDFYVQFFNNLDKKPEARDAYFELQAMLRGERDALLKVRQTGLEKMFEDAEYKARELQYKNQQERKKSAREYWAMLRQELVTKNIPLQDRVKALEKKGIHINPDYNPVFYLREYNYIGGLLKSFIETKIDQVYKNLSEKNISWDDFGTALFLERVASGDRSEVANPRGFTPSAAKEQLEFMEKIMGTNQWKTLQANADKFREVIRSVAETAYEEGLYGEKLYNEMKENPAYATFRVVEYLEEKVTPKIYRQIGTLKDVANPATSSVLKMLATIRAVELNKTKRKTIEFLRDHYKEDLQEPKKVFTGKTMRFFESQKENENLVLYFDPKNKGKIKGVLVDNYIAKSLRTNTIGQNNAVLSVFKVSNQKWFRPAFITLNLGFQEFNLIRDFIRFYKNTPGITLLKALRRYAQAARPAKIRAFGVPQNPTPEDLEALALIQKAEEEKILSFTFNDLSRGENLEDREIERIMERYGAKEKVVTGNFIWRNIKRLISFMENLGNLIETLPKAAGIYEMTEKNRGERLTLEQKDFIRRKIGSPDFLDGGLLKPWTNELFIFSNAITQGWAADYDTAISDPKTRSGWWWKTIKINFLPKVVMLGVLYGLFGDELGDMMRDVSEYDKTNYLIIPLGRDSDGKTIYLRIPQDETGRFLGGLFWKIISAEKNNQSLVKSMTEILGYTGGQLPGVSPIIEAGASTFQFATGRNPYDAYRGLLVLTDDEFRAGGFDALKSFLQWQFEQVGGGIIYRFNKERVKTPKTPTQKFFQLPVVGNILGRFIRISDFGAREALKETREKIASEEAQRRLRENKVMNKYIPQAAGQKPLLQRRFEEKFLKEVFPEGIKIRLELERKKRLREKFRLFVKRGSADANLSAVMDADTNNQKAAIISQIKRTMTDDEFMKFRRELLQNRIASTEVLRMAGNR